MRQFDPLQIRTLLDRLVKTLGLEDEDADYQFAIVA